MEVHKSYMSWQEMHEKKTDDIHVHVIRLPVAIGFLSFTPKADLTGINMSPS